MLTAANIQKLLYFYRKIWILHQNIPLMQTFTNKNGLFSSLFNIVLTT